MKLYWLLLPFLIPINSVAELLDPSTGLEFKINSSAPPSGIHIMRILIENQGIQLKGTGCSSDIPNDKRTLQHKLAGTLGHAIDNKRHVAVMLGGCKADKSELKSGLVVDTWHCNINVIEKTKRGSFIANASLDFWIKKEDWSLIPEKLLCM